MVMMSTSEDTEHVVAEVCACVNRAVDWRRSVRDSHD